MIVIDLCSLFGSFKLQDSRFHMRALKLDFVTCSDHVNNRHTLFFLQEIQAIFSLEPNILIAKCSMIVNKRKFQKNLETAYVPIFGNSYSLSCIHFKPR